MAPWQIPGRDYLRIRASLNFAAFPENAVSIKYSSAVDFTSLKKHSAPPKN
jgi:hypothetical protein